MSDGMKIYAVQDERNKDARRIETHHIADTHFGTLCAAVLFIVTGLALIVLGAIATNMLMFGFGGVSLAGGMAFVIVRRVLYHLQRIHHHARAAAEPIQHAEN